MRCFVVVAAVAVAAVTAQRAADNKNCKKPDGLFPHDQYCDYYYDCQNGEAVLQACPNGLAFAGKKKGLLENCDYPHKVGCPDEDNRVMGQSPESTDNCHWKYGIFAHATSCTRYWQCWNGTATNQQCPFSLLYNDAAHACDWPDNVPDCQKHPICKDVANGPIPIEKSCARYWLCVGGYPRLQRCSAGLAFNPETLKCELATTVAGCEPPPEVPDEEDGKSRSQAPPRSEPAQPRPQRGPTRPQPQPQPQPQQQPRPQARPVQVVQVQPATRQPTQPQLQPQAPAQQAVPAFRPAAQTEAPEYEYEDEEITESPTTQRPRRRNPQFG